MELFQVSLSTNCCGCFPATPSGGTAEAALWHKIASAHHIPCPYGASHKTEWNHCQVTPLKAVRADNPLRTTVTAVGPTDLNVMFGKGDAVIAQKEIWPSEGSREFKKRAR